MNVSLWTDRNSWDAYVAARADASAYHQWVWRDVIERTYAHKPFYLAATEGDRICGILPLFHVQSFLFGPYLVSVPFSSNGGVLAESECARNQLLEEAARIGHKQQVKYVESRQTAPGDIDWLSSSGKVSMWVRIAGSSEGLFAALSSRMRNKIRSAKKNGLTAAWGREDLLEDFYRIFSLNMRNLGTPVYPKRWFQEILARIPETRFLVLRDGQEAVAAMLVYPFRDICEFPWIASEPNSRRKYSTVLLYWTAIEWAANSGYRVVDLGRCTPGSGTYEFKAQWNCEEVPLHWYYWSDKNLLPQLRTDNPKLQFAIRAWQALPVSIANILGPRIVRAIP